MILTYREWVTLQQALVDYRDELEKDHESVAWDRDDGDVPSTAEIDTLAEKVGRMRHEGKPGTPKKVRCPACQDRPGVDGLGRPCKKCKGQGTVVDGTW